MSRNPFGWSYPPGAENDPYAPYNQVDPPCEVCGKFEDDCECQECPECGQHGCMKHLPLSTLAERKEFYAMMLHNYETEYKRRIEKTMVKCKKCETKTYADPLSGIPNYCPKCKTYLHGDGQVLNDYDFC